MKMPIEKNEMRVLAILADISRNTLFVPKTIKEKSCQLASPEAQIYFEYKNRYPTFNETII